jgi:hypothetical protein
MGGAITREALAEPRAERRVEVDMLGTLQQLGVIPARQTRV